MSTSKGGNGTGPAGGGGGGVRNASSSGSNTKVVEAESTEILTLELRPRRHIIWDDTVVDNEGMGRQNSKRC